MTVAALGVAAHTAGLGERRVAVITAAAGLVLLLGIPAAVAAGSVAAVAAVAARLVRARRAKASEPGDVLLLGELVALGLTAGLPFSAALDAAAPHLSPLLAGEVRDVLRRIHHRGAAAVLETAGGQAQALYRVAGRAALTGAPLLDGVLGLVDRLRGEERARRLAAARRLPVLMLLPLALLILPGFLLLTVVPALLEAVSRLEM